MDEILVYQALGCALHPCADIWNRGHEACRQFDVAPLSWLTSEPIFLPLRSYPYVGSLQGLFYLPLYLLWNSPHSARFFGVLLVGVQSVLISKTFGQPVLVVLGVMLLFMPYTLQHLIDTGQLSLCTTAIFLLVYLYKCWISALIADRWRSWLIVTMIGLINVAILLFRLNNVAYMPAFFLTQLMSMGAFEVRTAWRTKRLILSTQVALMVTIFLTGAFVWFTSVDRNNVPLYSAVLDPMGGATSDATALLLSSWRHFANDLSQYLLFPIRAAHVAHGIPFASQIEGIALIVTLLLLFVFGWFFPPRSTSRFFSVGCLLAFWLGVAGISGVPRSWAMHHLIPAFPMLILGLFSLIGVFRLRWFQTLLLGSFAVINITLYRQLMELRPADFRFDPRLIPLTAEVSERFGSSHSIVFAFWGTYYPQLLYGPSDECLVWAYPYDPAAVAAAERLRGVVNKPVLFITDGGEPPAYWRSLAGGVERVQTATEVGGWTLWRETSPLVPPFEGK